MKLQSTEFFVIACTVSRSTTYLSTLWLMPMAILNSWSSNCSDWHYWEQKEWSFIHGLFCVLLCV